MDEANGKKTVHISRHWTNPAIQVTVCRDGIALEISLEDFCRAVVAELPHPAFTMTRAALEKNVVGAIEGTLNKVKEATAYV